MDKKERLMVLKMLEEGKVSSEEALQLLDALKENGIDAFIDDSTEKLKVIFQEVKSKTAELAEKSKPYVEEAKEKIGEAYKKAEPTLKEAGEIVKSEAESLFDKIKKKLKK